MFPKKVVSFSSRVGAEILFMNTLCILLILLCWMSGDCFRLILLYLIEMYIVHSDSEVKTGKSSSQRTARLVRVMRIRRTEWNSAVKVIIIVKTPMFTFSKMESTTDKDKAQSKGMKCFLFYTIQDNNYLVSIRHILW